MTSRKDKEGVGDSWRGAKGLSRRDQLTREFLTMALYISIVIFAELIAIPEDDRLDQLESIALIWGSAIGLALAHLFAFELSAAFVVARRPGIAVRHLAFAQAAAAGAVAVVATLPILFLGEEPGYEIAQVLVVVLIGGVAFLTARHAGTSGARSVGFAALMLALAGVIIALKGLVFH